MLKCVPTADSGLKLLKQFFCFPLFTCVSICINSDVIIIMSVQIIMEMSGEGTSDRPISELTSREADIDGENVNEVCLCVYSSVV